MIVLEQDKGDETVYHGKSWQDKDVLSLMKCTGIFAVYISSTRCSGVWIYSCWRILAKSSGHRWVIESAICDLNRKTLATPEALLKRSGSMPRWQTGLKRGLAQGSEYGKIGTVEPKISRFYLQHFKKQCWTDRDFRHEPAHCGQFGGMFSEVLIFWGQTSDGL